MFAAAALVAWVGPAAKVADPSGNKRMTFDQFISRFAFPLVAGMFVVGAVAASSEVLPDNIWFHTLLVAACAAEVVGFALPLMQRRLPRRG